MSKFHFDHIVAKKELINEKLDNAIICLKDGSVMRGCHIDNCMFVVENEGIKDQLFSHFPGLHPERVVIGSMGAAINMLCQHSEARGM